MGIAPIYAAKTIGSGVDFLGFLVEGRVKHIYFVAHVSFFLGVASVLGFHPIDRGGAVVAPIVVALTRWYGIGAPRHVFVQRIVGQCFYQISVAAEHLYFQRKTIDRYQIRKRAVNGFGQYKLTVGRGRGRGNHARRADVLHRAV